VDEKGQIATRLREEILRKYGSIKAFSEAIGKTQQYVNVYLSGINSPGPKVRNLLERAGLDVPFIMTGRREVETGSERREFGEIKAVMSEKGIKNADELRQRLEKEEALMRMLGRDVYTMILKAAAMRDRRASYKSAGRKGRRP
jgi:transcriptional regulator with XRE-family HTH domain